MSELIPCPFCGESIRVEINTYTEQIVCGQCGAVVYYKYWDTRPIEDDLRKRIAELEGLVDKLIEVENGMKSFLTPYVDGFRDSYPATSAWESLVKDWKEG